MAGRLKLSPINLTKTTGRITVAATLLVIAILRLTWQSRRPVAAAAPGLVTPHPGLPSNAAQRETNSQKLLELLYKELFDPTNITLHCGEFEECVARRKQALSETCSEVKGEPGSVEYSGAHNTRYYYTYDIEVCSGNEANLLESLTFEVPTVQVVNADSGMTKILHMDNPLIRLYEYYQALRSGIGYLYLGEEIVYKFRDVQLPDLWWKLPYIYEARLGLLWEREGSVNPFENPFGPTFLEFMVYLVDAGTLKPSSWAPTVHNCHACQKDYDLIIRREKELQCLDYGYLPAEEKLGTYDITSLDIYNSFRSLPAWILAHVYEIYAADLNSFVC